MSMRATVRTRAKCANCGSAVRAKDRFCSTCGSPIAAAQAAPPDPTPQAPAQATDSASLQIPSAPTSRLAEQRKVVTILFADLSGSTPLAEKLDPEDLRGILGRYFNALARQIQRYEGTIDKYIGDAIMAVFGAPISHEDDAERAIHAALAMQASIQRLNDDLEREHGVRLALRIGVNTGEVVAGLLSADVQRAYTVVGDAVNTAQRFESVAPLNEVLVSETTRHLAIHSFEFETLPPVTLKGKAQPVAAYRVIRARDEEIPPEATALIGRGAELELLRTLLGTALTGSGQVLAISGEAGVGKSRLVGEFKANLVAGIDRLSARCASYETQTPYALVVDLLRGAFRIAATDDEASARAAFTDGFARAGAELDATALALLLEVLGYVPSLVEPERKRAMLAATIGELLARAGDHAPFVIAAEDLHWVDAASAALLGDIVQNVPDLPCLFITTARPGWEPPWPAERLSLEPLEESDARALIEEVFDRVPDEALVRMILDRTRGNPFFIEELVRAIGDARTADVPPSVQEVLEARIERLGEGPGTALENAAVIGIVFWYRILERLAGSGEPVAAHVAALEQEGFVARQALRPELTYAFRQPLIQEVAYGTQLLSKRRATHGAVGAAIEELFADRREEFVDLLAYHYDRSDESEKALVWLVRAGDRARRLYANDDAVALYTSALKRARPGTGEHGAATILERIGEVQTLVGRFDDAISSFEEAGRRGGTEDLSIAARLLRRTGVALRAKGAYDDALAALMDAVALAHHDEAEAARVAVAAGMVHFLRGAYAAARPELERSIALGAALHLDDVVAEGEKLLGNIANNVGALADAESAFRRSVALYERIGDQVGVGDVRSNLGSVYRRMGRSDDALREYGASLAIRERIGHRRGIATCHNNIGEVLRMRGDIANAVAAYQRSIAILDEIGAAADAAVVRMNLAVAHLEGGEHERARDELRDAERRMSDLGGSKFLAELHMQLARAHLGAGDPVAAAASAERSLSLARVERVRSQEGVTLRVVGEIALARGDREGARHALEESRALLAELGEGAELARTEALLGALGS